MLGAFATIFVVFATVTAIALVGTTVGGPQDVMPTTPPERVPFSGGYAPQTHAWNRFHVRYYVMALLFLTFDMEMVYMFPILLSMSNGSGARVTSVGPRVVVGEHRVDLASDVALQAPDDLAELYAEVVDAGSLNEGGVPFTRRERRSPVGAGGKEYA